MSVCYIYIHIFLYALCFVASLGHIRTHSACIHLAARPQEVSADVKAFGRKGSGFKALGFRDRFQRLGSLGFRGLGFRN